MFLAQYVLARSYYFNFHRLFIFPSTFYLEDLEEGIQNRAATRSVVGALLGIFHGLPVNPVEDLEKDGSFSVLKLVSSITRPNSAPTHCDLPPLSMQQIRWNPCF